MVGDLLIIGGDQVILVRFDHKDFRQDVLVVVGQESAARARFHEGDAPRGLLHRFGAFVDPAGDFRKAPFAQGLHVIADHAEFEGLLPTFPLQLQQQALAQIARADPRGMKSLNDAQHCQQVFGGDIGGRHQFLDGGLEVPVVVDVANDHFGNGALLPAQIGRPHLFEEIFLEGGRRHQRIEHELPLLFVLRRLAHRQVRLGEMVAPFLVQLRQPLEFELEIIHRFVAGLFGGGIERDLRRGFGGVPGFEGGVSLAFGFFPLLHFFGFDLLEDRVLLEFLFHQRFQFQRRGLQEGQRLLELWRQHLLHRQLLR